MTLPRSGYVSGQAFVQSLTPWTVRRISVPGGVSNDWPPEVDAGRLEAYAEYEALIENRPWEVFSRLSLRADQAERIVLALSMPELVCNVWADALWGENAPDITFPSDTTREAWDAIWAENGGDDELGWQAIFGAAFSGTGVEHVYRDDDGTVRIESIPPSIFFPTLRRGSSRQIETVTLAWEEDRPAADNRTAPWQIRKDYWLEGEQLVIQTRERKGGETSWREVDTLRPDGVGFIPFVDYHAKRWRGRFWGVSEVERNRSLFAEIDAGLSRLGTSLEYHGEPTLQVPASVLFGGVLPKGADRVIGIRDPAEAPIARYITYDSQIDGQLGEIDKIVDLVLLTSEIQKAYTGDAEGTAESGTALRLRLQGYMKKVGRWTRIDADRIRRLADMALQLSGVGDEAQRIAKYTAGNPLPVDDEQEVRILSMMLADGTISRKTYMMQTRRFDDVDAELEQIDQEQGQVAPTSGFGLPTLPTPTVSVPAGLGVSPAGTPPESRPGG
jgi:hypothetical protein